MFLKLNVLVFLVIALFAFCSSNDEFSRKRRIPYHMPGFWYHFLPNPMEDTNRYYIKRSWEPENAMLEKEPLDDWGTGADFLADNSGLNIPADGSLFGWDRRKKFNL